MLGPESDRREDALAPADGHSEPEPETEPEPELEPEPAAA